ncbi:MAG: hypothetical protein DI609_09600 [Corynebacterium urealyticum]|uniref:Prolipoprotein LppL n=1 Tax=Corynebacterium urealyticum TaxID=43771 RepID=A0A2W5AYV6_9CORY|nr:MAG: hypothetical protein DI609_09600 [Corynebacterium urealyticum]
MRRVLLSSVLVASVSALTACNSTVGIGADPNSAVYGHAEPAASPGSKDPAGDVVDFDPVSDLAALGGVLAVRTADSLTVGSAQDFSAHKAERVGVDESCGDLTASTSHFVLACGDKVLFIDPQNPSTPTELAVEEDAPITVAAQTSSGEVFVGSKDSNKIGLYKDGERDKTIKVEAGSDQLIAVPNTDGADGVVRVLRDDSTIQSLDWEKHRAGGRLRVGQGVGLISGGEGAVVVAADTVGERVAIYTASDVIRLHQYGNADGTPWATAWDSGRSLAWVTTTDNNLLQAFKVADGVPEAAGSLSTVADAQNVAVLEDGTVVAASATGDGLQFISDPSLKN